MEPFGYEETLRDLHVGTFSNGSLDLDSLRYLPYEQAMRFLDPIMEPLPESVRQQDPTLAIERLLPRQWTAKFFKAAFQEPDPEEGHLEGWEEICWGQLLDNLARQENWFGFPYSQKMIEARLSMLFPIALRMHEGGQSIYQAPGLFQPGSEYQKDLTFRARLERIEEYLRRHKWLVTDILEQRFTQSFVASPDRWVEARIEWLARQPLPPDAQGDQGQQRSREDHLAYYLPGMQTRVSPSTDVRDEWAELAKRVQGLADPFVEQPDPSSGRNAP